MKARDWVIIAFVFAVFWWGVQRSFRHSPMRSSGPTARVASAPSDSLEITQWCDNVEQALRALHWKISPCSAGIRWKIGGRSVNRRPLVYAEFGENESKNTTLVLATVHGDEVTPLYLGVELANWMNQHQPQFVKMHVVIAPLVNPDGFFRRPRTRMNIRGVDLNRNFPTRDWPAHALQSWKRKYRSDPRRYPGPLGGSEPETEFQQQLIEKVRPQKILSVHAPLNFMDYDGPTVLSLDKFPADYVKECLKLRSRLRAISSGFFPGSLGNYAGQELGIPTLTLELPSADPRKAEQYWHRFSQGIRTMIEFSVPSYAFSYSTQPGG